MRLPLTAHQTPLVQHPAMRLQLQLQQLRQAAESRERHCQLRREACPRSCCTNVLCAPACCSRLLVASPVLTEQVCPPSSAAVPLPADGKLQTKNMDHMADHTAAGACELPNKLQATTQPGGVVCRRKAATRRQGCRAGCVPPAGAGQCWASLQVLQPAICCACRTACCLVAVLTASPAGAAAAMPAPACSSL